MAIMQDDDTRFRNLSRKIGWFVLVAVAGILAALVNLGIKQGVLRQTTPLYFITDTGNGIRQGMAVKLSGFRIGKVDSLKLTNEAQVRVELRIDSEYMQWVRRDSRARLASEGLIGDAIIDIPPGSPTAPPLAANDAISFEREGGISTVVDKLYDQVGPLIQDIRQLTQYLNNPDGDVKQSLHRLNTAMAELNGSLKRIDRILAAAEKDMPATLRSTRETVEGGKKVVDSLQRTWPISGNIESPKPTLLPMDSYDTRPKNAKPEPLKP
jgi:phospholipid/cholesterol/gamma-HCH transport system substrate-binding protein